MPPTTQEIPAHPGRGQDAIRFLESHGIIPVTPTIRSSDYELCLSDPHLYYLTRRLGLVRKLSWSKARSRGSWFHVAVQHDDYALPIDQPFTPYHDTLTRRLAELTEICIKCNIRGDSREAILARERQDALCSLTWYQASSSVPISPTVKTFRQYLSRPYWRHLGRELTLRYIHPSYPTTPLVAQLDGLLYHTEHNTLWIVDFKTCEEVPTTRLKSCPIEFQTQHYLYILKVLVANGHLTRHFNIPLNATVMGMIHCAIQKPSIEFGQLDRQCRIVEFTPKSGKNKGITREEKEYFGEPYLPNYLKRVHHWYHSTGPYQDLLPKRGAEPTVNLSFSTSEVIDGDGLDEYTSRLNFVHNYAVLKPAPNNFLRSGSLIRYGKLSDYAPFSILPVERWPDIIAQDDFMIQYRDEETVHDDSIT